MIVKNQELESNKLRKQDGQWHLDLSPITSQVVHMPTFASIPGAPIASEAFALSAFYLLIWMTDKRQNASQDAWLAEASIQ